MQTFKKTHVILAAALALGCTVEVDARPIGDGPLSQRQLEQLEDLGVHGVVEEGAHVLLFSAGGLEIGNVTRQGPLVEIQLGKEFASIERRGNVATLECSGGDEAVDLVPAVLADYLEQAAPDTECTRALKVARIVTEIDTAISPACEVEVIDGEEQLACDHADDDFRDFDFCGCNDELGCALNDGCYDCDPFAESTECYFPDPSPGGAGGGGGLECIPACWGLKTVIWSYGWAYPWYCPWEAPYAEFTRVCETCRICTSNGPVEQLICSDWVLHSCVP